VNVAGTGATVGIVVIRQGTEAAGGRDGLEDGRGAERGTERCRQGEGQRAVDRGG